MIKILRDKNLIDVDFNKDILGNYKEVIIDLGTGNGKFVLEEALRNPTNFYIGIDPISDNIVEYYKKKKKKYKAITNFMFVISSIEDINDDLSSIADKVYVNFPWGSLLEGIVKGDHLILSNIRKLMNLSGEVNFTFTYSSIYEAGEISRRELPTLSLSYINEELRDKFTDSGLEIIDYGLLDEDYLKNYGTLWSKRIYLVKDRVVYFIKSRCLK